MQYAFRTTSYEFGGEAGVSSTAGVTTASGTVNGKYMSESQYNNIQTDEKLSTNQCRHSRFEAEEEYMSIYVKKGDKMIVVTENRYLDSGTDCRRRIVMDPSGHYSDLRG